MFFSTGRSHSSAWPFSLPHGPIAQSGLVLPWPMGWSLIHPVRMSVLNENEGKIAS